MPHKDRVRGLHPRPQPLNSPFLREPNELVSGTRAGTQPGAGSLSGCYPPCLGLMVTLGPLPGPGNQLAPHRAPGISVAGGVRPADLEIVGVLVCPRQEHGGEEVPSAHEVGVHLEHLHADALCHHGAVGVAWRGRGWLGPQALGQQRALPGLGTSLPASALALPCTAPGGLMSPMGAYSDRTRASGPARCTQRPMALCHPRGRKKYRRPGGPARTAWRGRRG